MAFFCFFYRRNPLSDVFTAALSHYLPAAPTFAPFPLPFTHLTPALETLAGSRALSALAQAQKRLRDSMQDQAPPPSKRSKTDQDPLDLSSTGASEDDVDVLSIDPPSPSNVEQWTVEQVVDFVSNLDTCREYAQVILETSNCVASVGDLSFALS